MSTNVLSMLQQRFACARLSHPYMTRSMSRLLTMTFTTAAFDRSSSWQFEASSYKAAPKGPPSSSYSTALSRFLDTIPCERFTSALADNPRITRGRYGSLLLHRDGLPPSTFCRSPGAPFHSIKLGSPEVQPGGLLCPRKQTSSDHPVRSGSLRVDIESRAFE